MVRRPQERPGGFVIAITGASGSGKTTLVQAAAALLGDAVPFFFDDYAQVSHYPQVERWLAEGADPNRWQTPQMAADLRALRRGEVVTNPRTQDVVTPASYIVMEEPFGRTRAEMRDLIDFVACIDVPLEVALARRLLRELERTADAERAVSTLKRQLPDYIRYVRRVYAVVNAKAMAACELVLDGTKEPTELAQQLVLAVKAAQSVRSL